MTTRHGYYRAWRERMPVYTSLHTARAAADHDQAVSGEANLGDVGDAATDAARALHARHVAKKRVEQSRLAGTHAAHNGQNFALLDM